MHALPAYLALAAIAWLTIQCGEASASDPQSPLILAQATGPHVPPPGSFPPPRPPPPNGATGKPVPDKPADRPSLIPPPDKPQNGGAPRSPRNLNPTGDPDVQRGIEEQRRRMGR